MNIVQFVMSGGWGGSEAIAFELANELSRSESIAVVVSTSENHSLEFYRSKLTHEVTLVDGTDLATDVLASLPFSPDILHGHLRSGLVRMRNIKGPKKVGHMHMRFYPSQFANTDAVVAVAPWQLADVPRNYPGQTFLVPNFLPHQPEPETPFHDKLKIEIGIPLSAHLVGTTGRLNHDKGFDVLIEAMRLVGEDVHCVIVGRGDQEDALRRQAEDLANVHFLGFRSDVMHVLYGLDSYVSSSRADSFGLSLLEAMHIGLPVAATKTFGGRYLLEHLPERLVEMEDHIDLASAINSLVLKNRQPIDYRLDRFDKRTSCAALLDAYNRILM
ncbi:glycosyltransferase family 4 protein [Agrobacterium rosae]|uniref:Glycosyltransferase family 4 protein n=1 Tax=Agrobacterium rosae TaxID=1972867 RepID=A0ABU4W4S9_9HYPH|nr:glycosyltransferase family 4 protein [Agrobacterium rosae]MDX8332793.1 glycosyltransferase family 4 protein [Agrobacterium rosae]